MSKPFQRIFNAGSILAGLFLLASWWSPRIDPRQFWPAAFLGLVFPYLYLTCLILAGLGLLWKQHKAWLLVLLLLLSAGLFRKSFFNFSFPPGEEGIRLLTHNIGSSFKSNRAPEWAFYHRLNPDILCFQEWHRKSPAFRFRDSLIKKYKHTQLTGTNFWPIFSRWPIIREGELKSKALGNGCTWADIVYQKDTFRLYNVHLVSNKISDQTEQLLQTRDLTDRSTWQKVKNVLRRYKRSLLLRADQAAELKKHMRQSPHPLVLAGDFNDIPASYVYRLLHEDLMDGFLQGGNGLAYTYAGKLPFLHIDNILISKPLQVNRVEIQRVRYSDHFPVLAEIQIH
ncbi:MAG TPA: endonuclease/exonuclease/phosphatase family protein [Saprospiraceae bacterium]|nr:endonuclease/exonuclease/phosphatase family protein [Saprospiraceae bacterium]HNT20500.1 endonuclease/exonuclease/phosphatase family protein [Saprospiraceae bacterium]